MGRKQKTLRIMVPTMAGPELWLKKVCAFRLALEKEGVLLRGDLFNEAYPDYP